MEPGQDRRSESGATLIELLVVTVILGVLAGIAIPVYASQRERALDATATSDLRNLIPAQIGHLERTGRYAAHVDELLAENGIARSDGIELVICSHPDEERYLAAAHHVDGTVLVAFDSAYGIIVPIDDHVLQQPPCIEGDAPGDWPPPDDPIIEQIEEKVRGKRSNPGQGHGPGGVHG